MSASTPTTTTTTSSAAKSPPPPRPPSTAAPSRPLSATRTPNPSQPLHPNPHQGMLYSMGAPTRAFPIKTPTSASAAAGSQLPDPHRVIANQSAHRGFGRGNPAEAVTVIPTGPVRSYGSNMNPAGFAATAQNTQQHVVRALPTVAQPSPPPQRTHFSLPAAGFPAKNAAPFVPQPQVVQIPNASSTPDYNSYKELRDDTVEVIHDRNVNMGKLNLMKDAAEVPLYGLCRSWLRNGVNLEFQPNVGQGLKILPRPLHAAVAEMHLSDNNTDDDDDENSGKEQDVVSVEHLSEKELLQGHIKRAKRVRARLRENRLRCIERYKQRLALLLPPSVDQSRADLDSGSQSPH
ncbi:hypothetical protein QJS10_CPB12g01532 [Acorus calamus]|uniref:Uncharacterized protein n=1 Tax=Acorus calamus TaxID=4465 RepID=A0AAV9DLS9_ACOCL|nr:hypothetical protein QJS10_CPB12g01532 [Acorus calamus]